jgi:methyl-accepting chemotaxis protein
MAAISYPRLRRRRYLVHSLQYRLLFFTAFYFILMLLAAAAIVFSPLILSLNGGNVHSLEAYYAAGILLTLHARFWPILLALFLFVVLHSMLMSHRIAGPLYRFRTIFAALGRGDLTCNFQLRERDYLREDERVLNETINSLRTRVLQIRSHSVALRLAVEACGADLKPEQYQAIEARMSELERSLEQFQLGPAPEQERITLDQERGKLLAKSL